jgi:hypothetical protein
MPPCGRANFGLDISCGATHVLHIDVPLDQLPDPQVAFAQVASAGPKRNFAPLWVCLARTGSISPASPRASPAVRGTHAVCALRRTRVSVSQPELGGNQPNRPKYLNPHDELGFLTKQFGIALSRRTRATAWVLNESTYEKVMAAWTCNHLPLN